jgi:hypothetical protein
LGPGAAEVATVGFLKSIVKIASVASFGAVGGLVLNKHAPNLAPYAAFGGLGGYLASRAMRERIQADRKDLTVRAPSPSATFVERRDPNQRDEMFELSLQRDLDVFRVPVLDLLQQ